MFSTKSFYGESPTTGTTRKVFLHQLKKRKKVEEREKAYNERPLSDLQLYVKVFSERKIWKWFGRQQDAWNYCLVMKEGCLRLFAYEKSNSKRKFLVTTLKQFWKKYSEMGENDRHFYEIIGMDHSCRLYFDIEYQKDLNTNLNGLIVLDTFINYVCHCLLQEYNIMCTRRNIVDLESSTDSKFSRHLIFHFEDALFVNNINCGEFVKDICHCLKSFVENGKSNKYLPRNCSGNKTESSENSDEAIISNDTQKHFTRQDLSSLIVKSNDIETYLCDLSVYSKNRNFRLYQSSKVSKNIQLVIAKENQFEFTTKLTNREKKMYRCKGEVFDPDFQKFCDTLICCNDSNSKILKYGDSSIPDHKKSITMPHKEGTQSTPYPNLDKFVIHHARKNCKRGVIRRWLMFDRSKVVIYDLDDNRWCGNIQREHKSNHIYYVADLKFKVLYQKCHDPDCCNFRSPEINIPDEVNPMNETIEIEEFDVSSDVELNRLFSDDFTIDELTNSKLIGVKAEKLENKIEEFDVVDDLELSRLFDDEFEMNQVSSCNDISNELPNSPKLTLVKSEKLIKEIEEFDDDVEYSRLFNDNFETNQILTFDEQKNNLNSNCVNARISMNDTSIVDSITNSPKCRNLTASEEEHNEEVLDISSNGGEHICEEYRKIPDYTGDQISENVHPCKEYIKSNINSLHYDFPDDIDFSQLIDNTPLRSIVKDYHFDVSGVDLFSPSSSPPLVSTQKREFIKDRYKQNIHNDKYNVQSFNSYGETFQSINQSLKSTSNVVNKPCSHNSELDSKILNELFSGENSDNEFSVIL